MATAEIASPEDVDALLADADALLNDVQSGLPDQGESPTATPELSPEPSDTLTDVSAETTAEPSDLVDESDIREMADEITATTKTADADAIMALLNSGENAENAAEPQEMGDAAEAPVEVDQQSTDASTEVTSEVATSDAEAVSEPEVAAADEPAAAVKPYDEVAKTAPSEWLQEADLDGETAGDDRLPNIPDQVTAESTETPAPAAPSPTANAKLGIAGVIRTIVHLPVTVLIAIDRPFAGLGDGIKTCIAAAALATLLVAGVTWFARDKIVPRPEYPQPSVIILPEVPKAAQAAKKQSGEGHESKSASHGEH